MRTRGWLTWLGIAALLIPLGMHWTARSLGYDTGYGMLAVLIAAMSALVWWQANHVLTVVTAVLSLTFVGYVVLALSRSEVYLAPALLNLAGVVLVAMGVLDRYRRPRADSGVTTAESDAADTEAESA